MATSYGFFNSLNGDRLYNADDVNTFLEGLVSPSGIYANVDSMLQVTPGSGLAVNVGAGKASVEHHWFKSDATETLSLTAAHQILNRIDDIVLRLDIVNRSIGLAVITGTPASAPTAPAIVRNDSYYDLKLAQVYINAGAVQVIQQKITDTRLDSNVCGIITGLVDQLDTSAFAAQLNAWMQAQTAAFEAWFETLTEQLNVNTYIQKYEKRVTGNSTAIRYVPLDMAGYVYQDTDILFVTVNGMLRFEGAHYTVNTSGATPRIEFSFAGSSGLTNNEVIIKAIKSKIGDPIDDQLTDATYNEAATNGITTTVTAQEVI